MDSYDNIKLVRLKTGFDDQLDITANLPPELRGDAGPRGVVAHQTSMQTDIFNLGSILWTVVKHVRPNVVDFCRWNNCPIEPTHWYTADHTNPVALPPCAGDSIPAYVDEVIEQCRQENSLERLSAAKLLELLPRETGYAPTLPLTKDLTPWRNKDRPPQNLACNRCGIPTAKVHYRCNVCENGDFDVCMPCYSIGVRCYDNTHVLFRRIARNGVIINEPLNPAIQ